MAGGKRFTLHQIYPKTPTGGQVSATIQLAGDRLVASYLIETGRPLWLNRELKLGVSQWGLWEWDVAELFVAVAIGPNPEYFEFQVSPLGQFVELKILEPRKKVDRDFRSGFDCSAEILPGAGRWHGEFSIPLSKLGWSGDPSALTGNLFAIQGQPPERSYWSAFLPEQEKPDFHLPAYFRNIV